MKKVWLITSFILFAVLSSLRFAEASQYDLKEKTPAVEHAISNRQNRYDSLQDLKTKGYVEENNRGYVVALNGSLEVQNLVDSENQDRRVIYETIASQNNLGPSGIPVIETVFGEVQREKARPGEMVQNPNGEWVKK